MGTDDTWFLFPLRLFPLPPGEGYGERASTYERLSISRAASPLPSPRGRRSQRLDDRRPRRVLPRTDDPAFHAVPRRLLVATAVEARAELGERLRVHFAPQPPPEQVHHPQLVGGVRGVRAGRAVDHGDRHRPALAAVEEPVP